MEYLFLGIMTVFVYFIQEELGKIRIELQLLNKNKQKDK